MSEVITGGGRVPLPLDDARNIYIDGLNRFRFQLQTKYGPQSDFLLLGESAQRYTDSFRAHLATCAPDQINNTSLGQLTVEEVALRRDQIAEHFKERPLRLHADTEVLIGGSALGGVVTSTFAGRLPGALGSGILATTSYLSFKYRRNHAVIDDSIRDTAFVEQALNDLGDLETATDTWCMLVFDATLQSEHAAVTRMAAQLLKARTYTPLGFIRLAAYNFHERRRAKRMYQNQEK